VILFKHHASIGIGRQWPRRRIPRRPRERPRSLSPI